MEMLRSASEAVGQEIKNDFPKALSRRFEVCVIPESSEKIKKLREVKAGGNNLIK